MLRCQHHALTLCTRFAGSNQGGQAGASGATNIGSTGCARQAQCRTHKHGVVQISIGGRCTRKRQAAELLNGASAQTIAAGFNCHGDDIFIPTAHAALTFGLPLETRKRPCVGGGNGAALKTAARNERAEGLDARRIQCTHAVSMNRNFNPGSRPDFVTASNRNRAAPTVVR